MDAYFWASRIQSAKHLTSMQASRFNSENHLSLDDYEGDDDARVSLPCPFCNVDIELPILSNHLQEEHCFDIKNAVCPVCAENLGKDMIGHFMLQHSHLLKRRRKYHRSGLWNNSSGMLGKELRDLNSFLGVTSRKGGSSTLDSTPDPLLSPFLCSVALPDTKDHSDINSSIGVSNTLDVKSTESSTSDEAREEDYKERSQRAEFIQQLILSTIF